MYTYGTLLIRSDNVDEPGSDKPCYYRTLCYSVIGLWKVLITFIVIWAMVMAYLLVIHQGSEITGRSTKIPENNNNYYQGFLGQWRLARGYKIMDGM